MCIFWLINISKLIKTSLDVNLIYPLIGPSNFFMEDVNMKVFNKNARIYIKIFIIKESKSIKRNYNAWDDLNGLIMVKVDSPFHEIFINLLILN